MKKELLLSLLVAFMLVGCGETTTIDSDGDGDSNSQRYEGNSDDDSRGSYSSDDDRESDNESNENEDEGDENEGDENNSGSSSISYHNQGSSCMSCHTYPASRADGKSFYSGLTVYTALDATSSAQYVKVYSLRALLSNGQYVNFSSGRGTGNFNSRDSRLLSYNYTAQVVDSSGKVVNSSTSNSHTASRLNCNSCHTSVGLNGASGRVTSATASTDSTQTPTPATPVTSTPVTSTPVTSQASGLSFTTDVMPLLEADCKRCHGNSGNFSITTASGTYSNISSFGGVNTSTPTSSKILTKSIGIGHGGGALWSTNSSSYITLKDWITQGALNN